MAASFIRSVNVGQNDSDTKESTRISFRYEGQSPESDYGNSVSSLTHHAAGDKQPSPMRIDHASGVHSVALHIQKTDVTLQGGRCPADQPSNVTAVGRPHVSTPEAFSKAATPIYIFINNSKIALFCYAIDIVSYIT